MVDKLYHRANPRSNLRLIARFVVEIQRFVCDRTTPPIIKKLRSKGVVAMHAWHFRILRVTQISIKWTWAEPFEMNVKIEHELNFIDDRQLFLDAQEAKKVSKRTAV